MELVAHCRAGFEAECGRDLADIATHAGGTFAPASHIPALATGALHGIDTRRWHAALRERAPIFARSVFVATDTLAFANDRLTPIVAAARRIGGPFTTAWLETPDSNEGKTVSGLCKRLQPLVDTALAAEGLLDPASATGPRLHVLFTSRAAAYIGTSHADTGSPWRMGIPRLRMPPGAPSRSTLKLAEAFVTFLADAEPTLVRAGMSAIDLGAAPGGWTWQLAQRGVRVTAVDNGRLRGTVAADPLVNHVHADGFGYRPRRPVDWLVCDIVEQPSRIAVLVAGWIARRDARRAIFNLKLPMKRRYEEVLRCSAIIGDTLQRARIRHTFALRQLYHDREEVTGYLAALP